MLESVRPTRRVMAFTTGLLLAALAVLAVGCVTVTSKSIPSGIVTPAELTLRFEVAVQPDTGEVRPVLSFRYPAEWDVVTASYTGVISGDFTESATIEGYFATTWETTAADKGHNGHKDGYAWFSGYAASHDWTPDDPLTVTIRVRPNGWSGDALLDFIAGWTDKDDPSDPAQNSDGAMWEIGTSYDHEDPAAEPLAAWLDEPMNLLPVPASFSDVEPGDDYYDAITALATAHIIDGKPDGTFRPAELVTRQQFAKMIVLSLGLPVSEADVCPFGDVDVSGPSGLYPDNFVAVAAANGITKGVTSHSFAPFNNITRAQVMTMVVRAAPLGGVDLAPPNDAYYANPDNTQRDFDDVTHGHNAQTAEANGLLWGIRQDAVGEWDPWRNATRGEVAQILWRLREKMD